MYQHQYAMYKLCFIIMLSMVFICVVSPNIKFSSGISLIVSNIVIVFSALSLIYCLYIPQSGDVFDVWHHETIELYYFTYVDIFSGLLDFTCFLVFVSMFFLARCWVKILLNLKGTRNFLAAYCLLFISVISGKLQLSIIDGVGAIEARAIRNAEIFVKKYDATEEMTERHARENEKSWSAQFLRAQFLWDTYREKEAIVYYEGAFNLLEKDDLEMKRYIEEKIKSIK